MFTRQVAEIVYARPAPELTVAKVEQVRLGCKNVHVSLHAVVNSTKGEFPTFALPTRLRPVGLIFQALRNIWGAGSKLQPRNLEANLRTVIR
jgi:hypothetical protein